MGHHQPFIHFFSRLPAERVDDFPSGFFEGDLRSLVRHHFPVFFPANLKKPFQTALGDAIKIISDMPKCLVIFVFLKIAKLANFEWCDQLSLSFTWFLEERFDGLPVGSPCAKQSVSVQISIFLDPCFPFFWKPCWAQYLNVKNSTFKRVTLD